MRMMGADSVAYHQATVMGRADDHAGQALAYYASRGETPLVWGGSGAVRLGLAGRVTEEEYAAIYGPGGAKHPRTGAQLAATRRPGMELVISAHKSVAELGVIGRAEDMHRIMDAERDATLAYLEAVARERGGRRGRLAISSPTGGLVYAHTRHATSRAGDPCPHDHILVANAVEMLDDLGGWKAADSTVWREQLHAATAVGRMAGARVAVELGYAIAPDPGRSGRLGHWRIAGIPDEVLDVHSKRAAEIDAAVAERGYSSYRARNIAARDTRDVKRHTPIGELMPRWHQELAEVGWSVPDLVAAVDFAAQHAELPGPLSEREVLRVAREALGPESRLSTEKVFTAADVVVNVSPSLFGRPLEELATVVGRVLAAPESVPLLRVRGARQQAYATASVLAIESAIAEVVAKGTATLGAPTAPAAEVEQAMLGAALRMGRPLTTGQEAAVRGICSDGRRVSLVLGVAGSGKTTAIRCVGEAYTAAGHQVIGTATSGQAARTLGGEAGIAGSRTLASLLWRLDHHSLNLTARHVVVLDEAGMTDDPAMLRLLTAADIAGAKVVLVGDHRQLDAVGPGGALRAVLNRHHGQVHVLSENVRQDDPGEGQALAELRAGDVTKAVAWYAEHDRIRIAPDHHEAMRAMVGTWAADVLAGKDVAMYAWRRTNVDDLNRLARDRWAIAGRLHGPTLDSGGRHYAAGDLIVTLAPAAGGQVVTSERGVVEAVDVRHRVLTVRMDDGRLERLAGEELGKDRLAHGYAITVHRSQASTVDIAHRLEDGGGRSLAYVSMSRAREINTVHLVADDLDQAVEDLTRDWSADRRARWAIDSGTPATHPLDVERHQATPATIREALRLARLEAQRQATQAAVPPDRSPELRAAEIRLAALQRSRCDLEAGRGRYADTAKGAAAKALNGARNRRQEAERFAETADSRRMRRHWRRDAKEWADREAKAQTAYDEVVVPEAIRLDHHIDEMDDRVKELRHQQADRTSWLREHPEVTSRLDSIERELNALSDMPEIHQELSRLLAPRHEPELHRGVDHGPDLGMDVGL
jgi:conjugative relaxase-like TrwC/TraI family protein